ncbi:heme-binding protein [Gillisia mitskevichiae]|uniref:Heme-binding protein n=1 Tax=Gillisia mitskevichiae TaxID=270921 RepID=A0A495PXU6_9FLAO|nr:heme-binding domain-containing protein [Gillisia mitskevichiae]RKS55063.1 heme-binding protein [Gillisia mitskevichiae]
MKILKILAIVALIALIVIQFFPKNYNQSETIPASDFIASYNPPKEVEAILRASCYDCHSNNTEYPWYNRVQPVNWYLADHVDEGKSELNFSEFGEYSQKRKDHKLEELIKEVKNDKMPLDEYTWLHQEAKLTDDDKKVLMDWVATIQTE